MTIYVPGDANALLEGTPVFGSVAEVGAAAGFASEVAADATWYALSAQQARLSLDGVASDGVDGVREKVGDRLIPGANTLHRSATEAKKAFDAYAAEVDRIHSEASSVVREVGDQLATIRSQAAAIEDIASLIRVPAPYSWNAGAPGAMPDPQLGFGSEELEAGERRIAVQQLRAMHEQGWLAAASRWRAAIEAVDSATGRWSALIEDRGRAEARLVGALDATTIGRLLSVSENDRASRRFTVATAISGELWGTSGGAPALVKEHPLLTGPLGSASGEGVGEAPTDPEAVAAAWAGLNDDERRRLIDEAPWVIGNLPGLPFAVRDEANRRLVEYYRSYPQELTPDQLELLAAVCEILKREESDLVRYGSARPPVQLVALDMTGEAPTIAVSYGDLDVARYTTWEVPGMSSDARRALASWDEASRNLYEAQQSKLSLTDPTANAVVAWLGYDTPDLPYEGDFGVLGSASAATGAARFAAELDGARAARESGKRGAPATGVLAHSYGTTLAAIALTRVRHPVDTLTMLGSAGLDTRLVGGLDELRVAEAAPGQKAIYTTHASGDRIAPFGAGISGRGQPNPSARAPFGAQLNSPVYEGAFVFSSEGDPLSGLKPTDGHSTIGEGERRGLIGVSASTGHGYLDRRTQSLDSVAQITTGRIGAELGASLRRAGDSHFGLTPALPNPLGPLPLIPPLPMLRETLSYGGAP
ncbi:alpha/beta hydrolase [Leucobacter sp. wl10]|uniref:alpha/beta hydrolase n=1 Tax=Leucobacter sp. wl10 TaxID=2304677 RepID=UPI000E5AC57A|nr:alpha/beta hydrolase [Leucobacter sp. wl10]RGE19474.1 hypothetical protein D1J51_11495 [Leucobacter sp. wl10]